MTHIRLTCVENATTARHAIPTDHDPCTQPKATFLGRSGHDQRKRSLGPVIRHIDMDKLLFEILA
jgi:hypothetical protein